VFARKLGAGPASRSARCACRADEDRAIARKCALALISRGSCSTSWGASQCRVQPWCEVVLADHVESGPGGAFDAVDGDIVQTSGADLGSQLVCGVPAGGGEPDVPVGGQRQGVAGRWQRAGGERSCDPRKGMCSSCSGLA
jgi:hypothetical protein